MVEETIKQTGERHGVVTLVGVRRWFDSKRGRYALSDAMGSFMEKVRNTTDGNTYKVFTWQGEGGIWRADIYEGGGFFAFRRKCHGQVVEPYRLDLTNLTGAVVEQSAANGTADYAVQAQKAHQRLVTLAQVEPPASWKMTADQIRSAEVASLQSISNYRAALQARIVEIMKREGVGRPQPATPVQNGAPSIAEQLETLGEERVLATVVAETAAKIRQVAGGKTPPPNEQRQIVELLTTMQAGLWAEFTEYYQRHGTDEESAKVTAGKRADQFRKRTQTELVRFGILKLAPGWDQGW